MVLLRKYTTYLGLLTKRATALAGVSVLLLTQIVTVLVPASANAANFTAKMGYYIGSGSTKTVNGLGFQPDLVIITASTTAGVSVFKTSAMSSANTAYYSATADNTASSITLTSDGFTIGTIANVNSANVLYRWAAFDGSDCTSTGYFCVGTYSGSGATSRTITTGFKPDMVTIKRSTAVAAHFRTASMASNRTEFYTSTAANTGGAYIASMSTTGFTVGTTDNTSGGTYNYFAFRAGASTFEEGTYSGNGTDNRNITGAGFQPDLVFVKNSTSLTANNRRSVMSGDKHFGDLASYVSDAVSDTTNMIQSMQSDGFQIGSGANTNESGYTMYWFAFGGTPNMTGSGSFKMAQGSYSGNGATRSISGVGFRPNLVMINGEGSTYAVFRTDQMKGDATTYFASATADFTGGITSLDDDGFSLGTNGTVNTSSTIYHWQAFGGAFNPDDNGGSADFATGAYYGNGIDSRNIKDIPFQPDLVVIKRNGASLATVRTSLYTGDLSGYFTTTADASNMIQTINSDGFQVGTSTVVNGSGSLYRWFAFKIGTNFNLGSYTGDGTNGKQIGAPFWSDLIWINRTTSSAAVQRPSTMSGTSTQSFMNSAMITNGVLAINASGFTVGTNASVNTSGGSYRYVVWRVPPTGTLGVDIVDSGGTSASSPGVSFTNLSLLYDCAESTAALGTDSERIRVANMTANGSWVLSIAPTAGPTGLWNNPGGTEHYDFNDIAGSPAGCDDGSDLDTFAGKLRVEPSVATITAQSGCTTDSITAEDDLDYSEGVTDSIPLATAAGANTECYWDITGVSLRQMIPKEQTPDSYTLGLTLTLIAQ